MSAGAVTSSSTTTSTSFDPDEYRMSVGEHLEELRWRLVKALVGFLVALGICIFFGTDVTSAFCKPLMDVLLAKNLNPQMYYSNLGDGFTVVIQIILISSAVIASPWMLFQIWQFVAVGLYPHERKTITRYMPLSIGLLVSGMLFVYFFVLPWTIVFFIEFGNDIPLPTSFTHQSHVATTLPSTPFPQAPVLDGDPPAPQAGQMWFNRAESRLKFFVATGDVRVIPFGPNNLLAPHITLPDYIDLVLGMLFAFGLSFQMPLVVMALVKIGIIEIDAMKAARSYVYFGLVIVAAIITPGSDIPSLVGLTIPLILLYELGLWLAGRSAKAGAAV
jgi:sec-independent protein translocase protein TatC